MFMIKTLIEQGWTLNEELFYEITASFDIQSQVTDPISDIFYELRRLINIPEEEYNTWLRKRGAAFPQFNRR
jgi:hypothetical protein